MSGTENGGRSGGQVNSQEESQETISLAERGFAEIGSVSEANLLRIIRSLLPVIMAFAAPPANDNFANAIVVDLPPFSVPLINTVLPAPVA